MQLQVLFVSRFIDKIYKCLINPLKHRTLIKLYWKKVTEITFQINILAVFPN